MKRSRLGRWSADLYEVAEDAVQETLLVAVQRWLTEGVPEHPRSWLIRVGYRRMVDLLRTIWACRNREMTSLSAMNRCRPPSRPRRPTTALRCSFCAAIRRSARFLVVVPTLRAGTDHRWRSHTQLDAAESADGTGGSARSGATATPAANQALLREVYDERLSAVCQVLYLIFNEAYTAS